MNGDAARKPLYTAEQREEALRLYREVGAAEASRECGINAATIRSWAHRDGIATTVSPSEQTKAATDAARRSWTQRRQELSEATGAAAADLLQRIGATKKPTDVRALDGSPSSRVEVSGEDRLERVKQLRDDLAMRREAKTG